MPCTKGLRLVCVLALCALGGCASVERDPGARLSAEQLQDTGEKFLAAGDVPQAIKYLTMAEQKSPKDPKIQYSLGLAYNARGMRNEAVAHLQNALAIKPDYSEVYNALGTLYAEQGQFDAAIENLQKALANPVYETPHFAMFNLGKINEKQNNPEVALMWYREAVRFQPHYGVAHFRMGQVLDSMHRGNEAFEAYGKAIEYAPDLVEAHLRYGIMAYSAGDLQAALYSLSRVQKLAPHSPSASEARKYLERLHGIFAEEETKTAKRSPSPGTTQLEVIRQKDVQQSQRAGGERPAQSPPEIRTGPDKLAAGSEPTRSDTGKTQSDPELQEQQEAPAGSRWVYVVQVASFVEKDNADRFGKRLQEKGYDAVVKPFTHQELGTIYVVQLKAVADKAQASKALTQIETEEQVKPILIRVSAGQ